LQGIQNLYSQLNIDRGAVATAIPSASDPLRMQIENHINSIQHQLQSSLDEPLVDPAAWTASVQGEFQLLTPLLIQALGMGTIPPATSGSGACIYVGGCIETVEAQCANLGGVFEPGQSCPPPSPMISPQHHHKAGATSHEPRDECR
jgi:hypothetical protein